jgi:hypothetical protein
MRTMGWWTHWSKRVYIIEGIIQLAHMIIFVVVRDNIFIVHIVGFVEMMSQVIAAFVSKF